MNIEPEQVVTLPGFGVCAIVARADCSLWTVRLPSGAVIKLGDVALRKMLEDDEVSR